MPRYKCFGAQCGVHGTLLTFLQEWKHLSYSEAIEMAAELAAMPLPAFDDASSPSAPAVQPRKPWSEPPIAPDVRIPKPYEPMLLHNPHTKVTYWSEPSYVHVYRNRCRQPLLLVVRFDQSDGRKYFQQVIWRPGAITGYPAIAGCWQQLAFDPDCARPLYGGEDIPCWQDRNGTRLLMVEGEKTRDAAATVLDIPTNGILTLSNVGSTGGIGKTDLKPVLDTFFQTSNTEKILHVTIWPDADLPARSDGNPADDTMPKFVRAWVAAFHDALESEGIEPERLCIASVNPPSDRKHGWDLADAVDEGWSAGMIERWIADNSQTLRPACQSV